MRVAFFHSEKSRERLLADAFLRGAAEHGHETFAVPLSEELAPGDFDVVAMVGVKSRERFRANHSLGRHVVYLDKGYTRHSNPSGVAGWEYWRVAINDHQPTARLFDQKSPTDRLERLRLELAPWRKEGEHVLIAGSSAKYHQFYGLKEPTAYAKGLVRELREATARPLVYRPKPSWKDAVPIRKTRFSSSRESLTVALSGAHAVVTHGSNTCFEAVLAGVPCVVTGNAVAKPLSSTDIGEIDRPRLASEADRVQWLANLAYWQWTSAEFSSGEAWATIGPALHG